MTFRSLSIQKELPTTPCKSRPEHQSAVLHTSSSLSGRAWLHGLLLPLPLPVAAKGLPAKGLPAKGLPVRTALRSALKATCAAWPAGQH